MAHNFAARNTFWKAIGRTTTAMDTTSWKQQVKGPDFLLENISKGTQHQYATYCRPSGSSCSLGTG